MENGCFRRYEVELRSLIIQSIDYNIYKHSLFLKKISKLLVDYNH